MERVLFLEHYPVVTAGIKSKSASMLISADELSKRDIDFHDVGRGGDMTAHEPGQLVIYPHIDLKKRSLGLSDYFSLILSVTQESILSAFSIETVKHDSPGLYVKNGAKLASIGIQAKSFFTTHGIAINIDNDLSTFDTIHPCGFPDLMMTSIAKQGADVARIDDFIDNWMNLFQTRLEAKTP